MLGLPSYMRRNYRSQNGFTLIELMITVAIVGILAAIAYPAYTSSLIKGSRASAQSYLLNIAQREQQYLLDSRTYADKLTLNVTEPTDVTKFYTVTITVPATAPPSFTATATPIAGTRQASDVTLSIDNTGAKLPLGTW